MSQISRFEAEALPHLDAAYNFARWLTRSEADAEDIVQEAMLRAFKGFGGFRGENIKPWLLTIVRNCWLSRARGAKRMPTSSEEEARVAEFASDTQGPEEAAIASSQNRRLKLVMALMPDDFREVLVLREIDDLSYQQIAQTLNIPTGTVMSRLARARSMLREKWHEGEVS